MPAIVLEERPQRPRANASRSSRELARNSNPYGPSSLVATIAPPRPSFSISSMDSRASRNAGAWSSGRPQRSAMATVTGPAPATSPIAAWRSRASSRRSSPLPRLAADEHDDRTAVQHRETARGADGESLADDVEVAPSPVVARSALRRPRRDARRLRRRRHRDQQIARLGRGRTRGGRPARRSPPRWRTCRSAGPPRPRRASAPRPRRRRGPWRRPGPRRSWPRPRAPDRSAQVLVGRDEEMARDLATDPHGDGERLAGDPSGRWHRRPGRRLQEPAPAVPAVRRGARDQPVQVVLDRRRRGRGPRRAPLRCRRVRRRAGHARPAAAGR